MCKRKYRLRSLSVKIEWMVAAFWLRTMTSLSLCDSSLIRSMQEEDPPLSFEEVLEIALHPTTWDAPFALRALSFLAECTASPSFVQQKFPKEFVQYSFPILVLPPFSEMVEMARVLDYLDFPHSSLLPLRWEIWYHPSFSAADFSDVPIFSIPTYIRRSHHFCEKEDMTLLLLLALRGYLSVLQRIHGLGCLLDEDACAYAVYNGHIDTLKWLRSRIRPSSECKKKMCQLAFQNGHLEILKWLRTQDDITDLWNAQTIACVVEQGHLEMLKWMRAQDPPCPWDKQACVYAIWNDQFEILKWLRSQDPPCPWGKGACSNAVGYNRLDILKWLRSQDPPCPWKKWRCAEIADVSHHDDILTWICSESLKTSRPPTTAAPGAVKKVMWLEDRQCPARWLC
jgi:hypothetical protein